MHAFEATAGGYLSWVGPGERQALVALVRELDQVLRPQATSAARSQPDPAVEARAGQGADPAGQERHAPAPRLPLGVREGESLADARTLACLDFDPVEPDTSQEGAGLDDPALAVLLPVSSQDPALEAEMSALTRAPLRQTKVQRLGRVLAELAAPSGPRGEVLVRQVDLGDWLGALNDLRVFVSHRLGVTNAQEAEQVHQAVLAPPPVGASHQDQLRHTRCVLYEVLTWWQESLLTAIEEDQGHA